MAMEAETGAQAELERENEELRRQVAELEAQLVEQAARTNELVARAQERVYWLDRWHIDLERLVAIPGVSAMRALVRAIRAPVRVARKVKRSLSE